MKKGMISAAPLLIAGMLAGTANASITYSVDRTIGAGSVNGTITTDGTLGHLTNGVCDDELNCQYYNTPGNNITDWSLTLFDGVETYTIDSFNSTLSSFGGSDPDQEPVGTNFIATESNLIYDFDMFGYALFQTGYQGDGGPSWLLDSEYNSFEEVWAGDPEERWNRDSPTLTRSGQVVIGWADAWDVPAPSSLALLALGLAGVVGSRRFKRM